MESINYAVGFDQAFCLRFHSLLWENRKKIQMKKKKKKGQSPGRRDTSDHIPWNSCVIHLQLQIYNVFNELIIRDSKHNLRIILKISP